jgi:uncharacterized membrane protein YeaQ/YmgE (transglycosylase-associated protein family)
MESFCTGLVLRIPKNNVGNTDMNVILWMLLGLLTGLTVQKVVLDRHGGSWLSIIILSVMGALLGGALHSFAQIGSIHLSIFGFMISDMYSAVLGAAIAIFLYGLLLVSNL